MVHLGRARVASNADFEEAAELIDTVEDILEGKSSLSVAGVGSAFREFPVTNEAAHSVAITALFPFARRLVESGKTKNPSWFRKGTTLKDIVLEKEEVFEAWRSFLSQVSLWRSTQEDPDGFSISIERGDSRKSLGRREAYHGLLTSPPYLTRLDYVHATLPEILLPEPGYSGLRSWPGRFRPSLSDRDSDRRQLGASGN